MGPIAWQYGQVGLWNSTIATGTAATRPPKLAASRSTALFVGTGVADDDGVTGVEVPPPPQPAAKAAANAKSTSARRLIEAASARRLRR
jgi:hypothetical protein